MKRRNELNMKPAAVIHMLSPRNFNVGSYTRSSHVGGLATVSRHPAVVHAGGLAYIYISVCVCMRSCGVCVCECVCVSACVYINMHISMCVYSFLHQSRQE